MTKKNLWKSYSQDEYVKLEQVNNAYKQYLNFGKTERECIKATIQWDYRSLLRKESYGESDIEHFRKSYNNINVYCIGSCSRMQEKI